jgi:hypothetical protein
VLADPASRARRAAERALALQIIDWYVESSTNVQRQRKGLQPPTEAHVLPLARLILQFRDTWERQGIADPEGESELPLLGKVYHHAHGLLAHLPELRDTFARGDCEARLIDAHLPALDAYLAQLRSFAAGLHLDLPPDGSRGRHTALVNQWAHVLLPSVKAVWRACGWKRALSEVTPDGPVNRIMCRALEAIDGQEHATEQVASALDRQRAP